MDWWRRRHAGARGAPPNATSASSIPGDIGTLSTPASDTREINRLDFEHYLLRQTLQNDYIAPIGQPQSILDVGCGTGRWAHDLSLRFPQARVVGLDLDLTAAHAAIQRATLLKQPIRCTFIQGDALKALPFEDESFDFVHMRLLFLSLPTERWPAVVRELARVTRRGGWIELIETTPPRQVGPALDAICRWCVTLAAAHGVDLYVAERLDGFLRDASVSSVVIRRIPLPLGPHGGRIGMMVAADDFAYIEGFRPGILREGIATAEAYAQAIDGAQVELRTGKSMQPFYIAYGQRM